MTSLSGQFLQVEKKIRQMAVAKMQQKMDHAAEMTMKAADKSRNYDDVTGNLYKSTAIGTYYNGSLQSIHYAPGPEPTRVPLLLERDTTSISIIAVRSPSRTAEGDLTRVNTEKVVNMVQTRRGMNLFPGSTTKESTMPHGRCSLLPVWITLSLSRLREVTT